MQMCPRQQPQQTLCGMQQRQQQVVLLAARLLLVKLLRVQQ
jgi:hypothetical protein